MSILSCAALFPFPENTSLLGDTIKLAWLPASNTFAHRDQDSMASAFLSCARQHAHRINSTLIRTSLIDRASTCNCFQYEMRHMQPPHGDGSCSVSAQAVRSDSQDCLRIAVPFSAAGPGTISRLSLLSWSCSAHRPGKA